MLRPGKSREGEGRKKKLLICSNGLSPPLGCAIGRLVEDQERNKSSYSHTKFDIHPRESGKKIFSNTHPLYGWALLHSAWIHNHFVVAAGATAYERSSDGAYSGKLTMFGECVLGYLKTDRKAAARWQRGIWLGKSLVNDVHIVAQGANIFVTRSTRRRPKPFELEDLGEVVSGPWEFGLLRWVTGWFTTSGLLDQWHLESVRPFHTV